METKTIYLTGAEQEVEFSGVHTYFHVHNLGGGDVLLGLNPGLADGKDNVIIVPTGGKGFVQVGMGTANVYVSGSGKVQVCGKGDAFSPFDSGAQKGGDEVTTVSGSVAVNTVEYPIVALSIYGKSVQEGVPHPDVPAEIVSVGDAGIEINIENKPESGPPIGMAAFISTGLPLCAIDGMQDVLMYRADGTGKVVKRLGVATLTAEQITGITVNQGLGNFFYTNIVGAIGENSDVKPLCNRFLGITFADRAIIDYLNVFRCFMGQDGRLILRNSAADNRFTTVAEMQAFIEENETVVIYPLATAQEIELSATEMAELQALRTFNGLTTISNDEGAEMAVKVAANPLLSEFVMPVLDGYGKRIEELEAAQELAEE